MSVAVDLDDAELRAFVGLGGNIGDRLTTLRSAARALANDVPDTRLCAASPIYETRPIGPSTEPFFNAAVELRTRLPPPELLRHLLAIELRHGRSRRRRWDARTLDLDLLIALRRTASGWGSVTVDEDSLRLPHPRMVERDFVLVPLADLAGSEAILHGRTPADQLEALDPSARTILRRVDEGRLDG